MGTLTCCDIPEQHDEQHVDHDGDNNDDDYGDDDDEGGGYCRGKSQDKKSKGEVITTITDTFTIHDHQM